MITVSGGQHMTMIKHSPGALFISDSATCSAHRNKVIIKSMKEIQKGVIYLEGHSEGVENNINIYCCVFSNQILMCALG